MNKPDTAHTIAHLQGGVDALECVAVLMSHADDTLSLDDVFQFVCDMQCALTAQMEQEQGKPTKAPIRHVFRLPETAITKALREQYAPITECALNVLVEQVEQEQGKP